MLVFLRFLFFLLIFFQIFHTRLCCSIKVNRKDQVDIAFFIIFDEARCFRIHQINCYFFVVDNTKCINQELRIENCRHILEYNDIRIVIQTQELQISVWGKSLQVDTYATDGVLIHGTLQSIELEQRGGRCK